MVHGHQRVLPGREHHSTGEVPGLHITVGGRYIPGGEGETGGGGGGGGGPCPYYSRNIEYAIPII